eukprot:jgi/Chrzof1/13222/Cz07g25070.t1
MWRLIWLSRQKYVQGHAIRETCNHVVMVSSDVWYYETKAAMPQTCIKQRSANIQADLYDLCVRSAGLLFCGTRVPPEVLEVVPGPHNAALLTPP